VSGSGFLVDSSGYVVTNVGVVANSNSLVALLAGDAKPHDARLIDFDCQTQVAVVKIDGLRSLPTLPWADPAALQLGQTVVALAGPASVHSLVTRGIVSATHQEGSTSDPLHPEITRSLADTIQTDASSDSQSSGGPLLNVDGQVMGVTVNSPSTSSAFALSTAAVQPEVDQIIGTGSLSIATLGITSQDLGLGEAALHGEPVGGALVKSVDPGGPADRAGIKVGDVIRQLDDVTLDPAHPLSSVLRSRFTPSQKSTVTYQRDGSTNQVALTLSGGHPSC
jgi:serine protease Do